MKKVIAPTKENKEQKKESNEQKKGWFSWASSMCAWLSIKEVKAA